MSFSRRTFLSASAAVAGGLVVAVRYGETPQVVEGQEAAENPFDAWVHIEPVSGRTEIVLVKSEMGQGVFTALPMMIAEEAELDWEQVSVIQSDDSAGTGGSGSVLRNYIPYRRTGALVRECLVHTAASEWNCTTEDCFARKSRVIHRPSGRTLSYGSLVTRARQMPLREIKTAKLKDPKEFTLIGRPTAHLDIPDKVLGKAKFGLDVRVPEMVYAVVAQCPTLDGEIAGFHASKALAVAGVLDVFEIPAPSSKGEVAVVAKNTWAAMEGRRALEITWRPGRSSSESTGALSESMRRALDSAASWSWHNGHPDPDSIPAAKRLESIYEFPFLAHATLEPMNTTVHLKGDRCEVWAPTQSGIGVKQAIAKELRLPLENVLVHVTFMGGAFGRRFGGQFERQAAQVAKRMKLPVQLVWTREDDMTHDVYRPACIHRLHGGFDDTGNLVAWSDTIADTYIIQSHHEQFETPGAVEIPYAIPNIRVSYAAVESAVPRGVWRSVGPSFNGVAVECFIDELAHAADEDPYTFRRRLIAAAPTPTVQEAITPRPGADSAQPDPKALLAVLDLAAEKSDWKRALKPPQGRGMACWQLHGTLLAQVAEVTVKENAITVDRIVTVLDCGQVVNPNGVRAQIEGGTLFGLSGVLKEEITVKDGAIQQKNFDTYKTLRMPDTPTLETYLIDSGRPPGGIGEAAVPLAGPSVANAIFAATGKRLRKLPFRLTDP